MKANRLPSVIYSLRQKLGFSQTEFAHRLGVTAMSVSRWETGANDPPADCTVKMAILSGERTVFWSFLGRIGFTKRDFAGKL